MTKRVKITFGIGYGRHHDEMEFEDHETEEEIEEAVRLMVLDRLDWGFEIEEGEDSPE
jgi:hypothetical protein